MDTPTPIDLLHTLPAGPSDPDRGYLQNAPGYLAVYPSKADAVRAARSIGWTAKTVARCHSRFMTRFYALHHPDGGFLTDVGLKALRAAYAAEHHTRTYQRGIGTVPYNVNSRGMTGYRYDFETTWVCTCGNGGFGDNRDRASAQRLAKRHRENPEQFPGTPWRLRTFTVTGV